MTFLHGSCKCVSDGKPYVIIVLVVLLMLHGEAVTHVRIPCVLVYVVATMTQISTLLPLPRHWTC